MKQTIYKKIIQKAIKNELPDINGELIISTGKLRYALSHIRFKYAEQVAVIQELADNNVITIIDKQNIKINHKLDSSPAPPEV